MNTLMTMAAGQPLTMSSREIADLTGKEHKNVIRDIRAMLDEITADGSDLSHVREEKDARGYTAMFHLNRELTDTLLTGYSAALRRRVVARWHELERGGVPKSFAQALRLAAEQQEQIELQQAALEAARPKVVYADAMLNSDGTVLVRDAAKTIGVPVRKLEKALRQKGVILPDNAPAARYVAQGYFKESLHTFDTNTRGRQLSRVARVTGRGLEFLRRFVERHADLFSQAPRASV
ncbi:phage regulatory protein/antirepressor Ant [Acidovorax sp. ACV02]|uniref:phage regulatory protein/antirepressor Ant n=1 Tax=Acidovorax sp. ACV02 TaxID=2769310 RepID=UPI001783ABC1|nr:phage regulatory protein/antirepressor Ant [Acidovorax sp. ACV02]MBD9406271.1 phage regulatory protein/antirepressor Ant [Acidovorax sp. ACV02]